MSSPYVAHRRALMERLAGSGAAAVVFTATTKIRNHDCEYRFRPDSDFWYLTGFAEPEAALLLLPDLEGKGDHRSVLFLRERDPEREIWDGRRLGVERAPETLEVEEARPIEDLWDDLSVDLKGYERILYRTGQDPERDRQMLGTVEGLRRRARGSIRPPVELLDHAPFVHEQRLLKSAAELERMRKAAAITTEAHMAAMATATPGMNEREIDALLDYTFRRRGSTGAAYGNIVAGGANACVLHYVENDAVLGAEDLLLIDAGAEYEYYASDVTRTFPVSGTFSEPQRQLYEVVLAAQEAAIQHVRPGVTFESIHGVALQRLVEGLVELGLCSGTTEGVISSGDYRRFFMHQTSHWLGLDVHDCGFYSSEGASRSLEPGMVLTVEPGLYVDPEEDGVEERWLGIGIRIEDDVLVTGEGHEVLTAGAPKSVEAVEAACKARHEPPGGPA